MSGIMDFLSQLFTDPYQQGGGAIASLLNPGSAASTATPLTPVSPVAGSPFQFRPGLLGDSIIGRAARGALSGLASSTGYTGGSAIGAGFEGATEAARKRQLFNMQNLQAGQEYQGGALNLLSSRLQLERTFKQYQYFQMIPKDMTFDQWVATQGQIGQVGAPGGPPAGAPQVGQGDGTVPMPMGPDGVARPYANGNPQATPPAASIGSAPQVGQTQPQAGPSAADNAYGIDPDLVNVTDPSSPKVQYALQRLGFMVSPQAAELAQKNIIAGIPYQTGLATITAQAQANNANLTDKGPGTSNIGLRNGVPYLISRNPIPVAGYNKVTGAPTTTFAFPPMEGAIANSPGAAGSGPTTFETGPPPGQTDVWKAAADRDSQLRDLGGGVNTRINLLQNLGQLASDTKFGTGRETQYTWEKLAQLVPGVTIGQTDAENMDIFKKFVSNLGVQYQQASGGKGTDAQLENALEGLPSVDKLSGAIQKIVPYMIAQESAIKGQLNARSLWKQQNGDSPASLLKFEDKWRNNFDPEVYQFEQMTPDQQAAFKANLSKNPKKFTEFRNHLMALTQLGGVQ